MIAKKLNRAKTVSKAEIQIETMSGEAISVLLS
jgi:hypothetical protein